ncbi:uncharacterized protein IWZ02DRAFT_295579 [Phyllosticta citriasiana]|uniref:uncharacterized protein n=1 Tax=Phyllosticta citriasiana TaxID=595635 RepID=UPI0030FDE32A
MKKKIVAEKLVLDVHLVEPVLRVSIRKLREMDDANQDTIGDIFMTALEYCKVFLDVKTTLGTQDDGHSPLQAVKRRVLVILTKASELDEQIKDSVGTVILEGTIQEVNQFLVNATDAETAKLAINTIARHAIASMLSKTRTIENKLETLVIAIDKALEAIPSPDRGDMDASVGTVKKFVRDVITLSHQVQQKSEGFADKSEMDSALRFISDAAVNAPSVDVLKQTVQSAIKFALGQNHVKVTGLRDMLVQ